MNANLSADLDNEEAIAYFTWDDPMSVREIRDRLRNSSPPERLRLLGKILREARDTDVWRFVTPEEVSRYWKDLLPHLGRRRRFWEWLFGFWRERGLLHD